MAVAAKLSPISEYDQRHAERFELLLEASLRELGATGADVRLHNLSIRGFMCEADAIHAAGSYVWLRIAGVGAFNARIVWRDSFRYGCEFIEPIEPEQCAAALAQSEAEED